MCGLKTVNSLLLGINVGLFKPGNEGRDYLKGDLLPTVETF